jgi:hypothetical protein
MGGYNSFPESPTYNNPGMQMSPEEMGGQQAWGQDSPQQYGMPSKPTLPQFNAPGAGGLQAMRGGMGGQPSAYSQQLNRFIGAGGQFNNFKPRMGAVGPQYRNGITPNAPQQQQQPPATDPPNGSIELPKPILPTWG